MAKSNKIVTIPSYQMKDTSHPNMKRFVDRNGNWTHYWLVEEKRFVKAVNHVIRLGYPKGKGFFEWLKRATPEEADQRLLTAGEEGTRCHQAIRDLTAGLKVTMQTRYPNDITKKEELLNDDEWGNLQGFINWCETYKPEFIADDIAVYSTVGTGYAGTADFFGTVLVPEGDKNFPKEVHGKRVLVLPDWKTSSALWPEYELQVTAYARAIFRMGIFDQYLKSYSFFGMLVRIGSKHKCGYEVRVIGSEEMDRKFGVFLACMWVANDQEPEFDPEVKKIPWSFQYKMGVASIKKAKEKINKDETIPLPLPKGRVKKSKVVKS